MIAEAFNSVRRIYTDGRGHVPEEYRFPTENANHTVFQPVQNVHFMIILADRLMLIFKALFCEKSVYILYKYVVLILLN